MDWQSGIVEEGMARPDTAGLGEAVQGRNGCHGYAGMGAVRQSWSGVAWPGRERLGLALLGGVRIGSQGA